MYDILLGSDILYSPGSEDYTVYDTELNLEVCAAGEFYFKVPPSNPLYSSLTMGNIITIRRNKEEYWRGEVRDIRIDFNKIADVYCLEDMAWLSEEYIPPSKITNETYSQRLTAAISAYNTNRPSDRQFVAGSVYNGSALCTWKTEYEWSILDDIRNCICRSDYYVKIRRVTSGGTVTRYVDVVRLEDYGVAASQPIEYGYNLLDYVKDSDYGNLVNVLTPYGDVEEDSDGYPVPLYDDYSKHIAGTTITDPQSISVYGRHAKAVIFDGVKNLTSLNNLAASYISRYSQPQLTMEVSAVDLAEIEAVNPINLGDSVKIIAKPFAINQRLYLTEMVIDLQNIGKNKITLSGHVSKRTLTNQLQKAMEEIAEIPEQSETLTAARRNALNLLLDETQGGYVVYEYDSTNSYMVAINICNAKTIAASTKRWRWSQNGFGYMYRNNTTDAWTGPTVAMTMNGEIVADFVTTGTMSAARIKGGTLELGGYNNNSGVLVIKNSAGTEIGRWDNGGITASSGTFSGSVSGATITGGSININNKFQVNSQGTLTCTGASISGDITVGGYGNQSGSITIKNRSGSSMLIIDHSGISGDGLLINDNSLEIGDVVLNSNGLAFNNLGLNANGTIRISELDLINGNIYCIDNNNVHTGQSGSVGPLTFKHGVCTGLNGIQTASGMLTDGWGTHWEFQDGLLTSIY